MIHFFLTLFFGVTLAFSQDLMLAKVYKDQNISGWRMSEKLDGVRGVWNGKTLLSKQGMDLKPPKWFIKNFPPFKIEGELWTKRGDFENIVSIVNRQGNKKEWRELTLNIFDVMDEKETFEKRIKKAVNWFQKHPSEYAKTIKQIPCKDERDLHRFLKSVEKKGGEGVIVRDPKAIYKAGRSIKILKVKTFLDDEAEVIGINPGKGKFKGLMGSLKVRLKNGIIFNLGSGFSDKQRKNLPKIGEIVTFKYKELTKNGKPKFASFLRIRKDGIKWEQ